MDQIHEKFIALHSQQSPLTGLGGIEDSLTQLAIFPRSFSVVAIPGAFVYTFGYNDEEPGDVKFQIHPLGEHQDGDSLSSELNALADVAGDVICHSLFISHGGLVFVIFMSKV